MHAINGVMMRVSLYSSHEHESAKLQLPSGSFESAHMAVSTERLRIRTTTNPKTNMDGTQRSHMEAFPAGYGRSRTDELGEPLQTSFALSQVVTRPPR